MIARYQARLSGPLLDRIDIHIEVPRVDLDKLADSRPAESSTTVRERVHIARARGRERLQTTRFTCNTEMSAAAIRKRCHLAPGAQTLLRTAATRLALSARAYHRVIKLAHTIADLANAN